ncbi:glutamyl-tRNA reductase [Thermus filiformis]|uniref:glutamyl-tRNA reductase n=1 Tax=Thermus filiformis TaxID=276 RepID=UPI0005ECD13A|nr:glutamyl-tRNA reductase [Thermus filiformis]
MLPLFLVGLSHKTAPLEVREKAVLDPAVRLPALLDQVRPLVALSTCNRTELYFTGGRVERAVGFLRSLGVGEEHLYVREGLDALRHLYRVAAGLDSLVVGESQILGQVREALFQARRWRSTDALLEKAFLTAVAFGKRARSETLIGQGAVSVAYAAVDLAQAVYGDLTGLSVAVLGAGEMAQLLLVHLRARGVGRVLVVNRSLEKAEELARRHGGEAWPLEGLGEALRRADIVVASAGGGLLVRPEQVPKRERPLFLIDIALPRNVHPGVGRLPYVYLYNLDDLERVVRENLRRRQKEAGRVEALLEDQVSDFLEWYAGHRVREAIRRLKEEVLLELKKELPTADPLTLHKEAGRRAHPRILELKRRALWPSG